MDIVMPRAVLGPSVKDLDGAIRSKLPITPELRLLHGYAEALTRDIGELSGDTAARSAAHLLDLAVMAVGGTRDAAETARGRGVCAVRFDAIKSDIRANATRADMSLDFIATRHNLSPQYLRSLFNRAGTSFTDFVLEERLDLARRMLADPLRPDMRISEIAFEVGFNDLSYFNRTFRRRFGMTPSDARAEARSGFAPR
jgi:AraC-like DNA-binding protein